MICGFGFVANILITLPELTELTSCVCPPHPQSTWLIAATGQFPRPPCTLTIIKSWPNVNKQRSWSHFLSLDRVLGITILVFALTLPTKSRTRCRSGHQNGLINITLDAGHWDIQQPAVWSPDWNQFRKSSPKTKSVGAAAAATKSRKPPPPPPIDCLFMGRYREREELTSWTRLVGRGQAQEICIAQQIASNRHPNSIHGRERYHPCFKSSGSELNKRKKWDFKRSFWLSSGLTHLRASLWMWRRCCFPHY